LEKEVRQIECSNNDYRRDCLVSDEGGWKPGKVDITILKIREVIES